MTLTFPTVPVKGKDGLGGQLEDGPVGLSASKIEFKNS